MKDAVVVKGWELLMDYEGRNYTGDVWVDQSIGYLSFAMEEHNLFECMFDGRNYALQRQMGFKNWMYLFDLLEGYKSYGYDGNHQHFRTFGLILLATRPRHPRESRASKEGK